MAKPPDQSVAQRQFRDKYFKIPVLKLLASGLVSEELECYYVLLATVPQQNQLTSN